MHSLNNILRIRCKVSFPTCGTKTCFHLQEKVWFNQHATLDRKSTYEAGSDNWCVAWWFFGHKQWDLLYSLNLFQTIQADVSMTNHVSPVFLALFYLMFIFSETSPARPLDPCKSSGQWSAVFTRSLGRSDRFRDHSSEWWLDKLRVVKHV